MFGDSRPIALRRLLPFSKKFDARKHRNSDSIHSTDEEPLLMDEETGSYKEAKKAKPLVTFKAKEDIFTKNDFTASNWYLYNKIHHY
ncbi:hypothetical protein CU098_006885 [Rhizopus stolonifer]|uniref:Uncharacterized protein n=1 Tax=Rhizopus stolonifer TaxID=4846 RepID=A0A367JXY5_RHIST|nr:hypothetical protein CU098_006885 [Rhizopus stolonifer]